jgi:sulfite oxidase
MPFGKPADTVVHQAQPFNAEPPAPALAAAAVTPVERFYVRNHGEVPEPADALRVDGLVEEALQLTVAQLRGRFAAAELTATLQCAGNRRAGLMAVREIPGEAPWGPGATGTATWRGARLHEVLAAAGVRDEAAHVVFHGADHAEEAQPPQPFAASIPLEKALRSEVLLAWGMNGAPLEPVHGAPLRAVVPGYIGARSVKWLTRVELRAGPWEGYFQHTAYRLLRPDQSPAPGAGIELGEIGLNCDVLSPAVGARVPAGRPVELRGYAFAGGERHVTRVELSLDDGATWREAELLEDLGRWAWRLWRASVTLPPGEHTVAVRAWDSAATTQPESAASLWNPKGYVNSAWGHVRLVAT